jgi:DNA gyrase subunit A
MGRFVGGVRGVTLEDDDVVVGMIALRPESMILTVCENGYGKRTRADEYRLTKRGGKGVINIKTTDRNGKVIAVLAVLDNDELIMISQQGQTIRSAVSDMRALSRATMGVRLIDLIEVDTITSVARIEEDKDVDGSPADAGIGEENGDAPDDEGGEE